LPSEPLEAAATPLDHGLLSPATVGHDDAVTDAAVLAALVDAEVALVEAYGDLGAVPRGVVDELATALRSAEIDVADLAAASVSGGNPVIPLVGALREGVSEDSRAWVHRGATSQDILDTALMLVARRAAIDVHASLRRTALALTAFAAEHRDVVAAGRTLTQHAVPTTIGLRASNWLRGVERAAARLDAAASVLPAQLGGAAGTLAAFGEVVGADAARLPAAFAARLSLVAPDAPWHTTRWPLTEFGDALVQVLDALGVIAADVATASRTEIGELAEGSGGSSSAMPQKQNPAAAVLIRSAALRAPMLGATLHTAAALAVDERPDGAWHAEWPTLRELLRLALGASAHAASLVEGLRVDTDAVARNLAATRGLIVAERLSLVLGPVIGRDAVAALVADVQAGGDLRALVRAAVPASAGIDIENLIDPAQYTGRARALVDDVTGEESR
jgi:3-carboxy-cis,cis-muconate cycloisomerase